MKALMKDYMGEQLVYVNVKYSKEGFIDQNNSVIRQSNILDIYRDNRKNMVVCSNCGEMIKNTPEDIDKHWMEKAKHKNCFTCQYARERSRPKLIKKTVMPDPNNEGRYIVNSKYSTEMYCNNSYGYIDINTPAADLHCAFLACQRATYRKFTDFFLEYPHAFEVLPTVDMLIEKKWKIQETSDRYLVYTNPKMKTLTACVNSKGVVVEFKVKGVSKGYNAVVMYSKKYDKIIFIDRSKYLDHTPWYADNSKMESAAKRIKELF